MKEHTDIIERLKYFSLHALTQANYTAIIV